MALKWIRRLKNRKIKGKKGLKKRGAERTVHNTFRFTFHPEINYSLF